MIMKTCSSLLCRRQPPTPGTADNDEQLLSSLPVRFCSAPQTQLQVFCYATLSKAAITGITSRFPNTCWTLIHLQHPTHALPWKPGSSSQEEELTITKWRLLSPVLSRTQWRQDIWCTKDKWGLLATWSSPLIKYNVLVRFIHNTISEWRENDEFGKERQRQKKKPPYFCSTSLLH